AQRHAAVLAQELGGQADVARGHRVAVLHEAAELVEDLGHRLDAPRLPVDEQLRAVGLDPHLQHVFEETEVLVVGSKESLRAPLGDGDGLHASINRRGGGAGGSIRPAAYPTALHKGWYPSPPPHHALTPPNV